jgi:hypothetical protein
MKWVLSGMVPGTIGERPRDTLLADKEMKFLSDYSKGFFALVHD